MQYDPDIKKFFTINYDELARMALFILNTPTPADDLKTIISDFYIIASRNSLLDQYDHTRAQLSTYVCQAMLNSIHNNYWYKKRRKRIHPTTPLHDNIHVSKYTPVDTCIDLDSFVDTLTLREQYIVKRLLEGASNPELVYELKVSHTTVYAIRRDILRKWKRYNKKIF